VLLVLIGTKLLLKDVLVEGPTTVFFTLGTVAIILAGGVISSLLFGSVHSTALRKFARGENNQRFSAWPSNRFAVRAGTA
jgi:hypothetical protein